MKILHVLPISGYLITKHYIRFIKENFGLEKNSFAVIGRPRDNSENAIPMNNADIKYFDSYIKNYFKIMSYFLKFDKVLFHSLSIRTIEKIFFLLNPLIMKRLVWIAWGYDLYHWKKNRTNMPCKVANIIDLFFRKKINNFVGIFPPDVDYFKKTFNSNAQTFYASYVGGLYNPIYTKDLDLTSLEEKKNHNSCINIQIGHSSTQVLNHIEVLEDLYKFRDENIRIYIPLSYGDEEYGDQVEKKAKLLFGDKAVCFREMMSNEDYMKFLSTIDIAIFNTFRQIGLGNIHPLLYMEKKIFMPAGSVMYDYYRSLGINICDYKQIKQLDFRSFTEPIDMTKAKQFVKSNATNKQKKIEMWSKVFNAPLKWG